jgi:hypothetical protein
MMEAQMSGPRMVGGVRWLVLCIATLGATSVIYPESLSARVPESYPAVRLVALDATSAEAMGIDSAFSQLEYVSHRGKPVADLEGTASPESPRTWRKVEPHPYLSEVLPGVEFYSVVGRQGRREGISGSSGEWLMARRQGQWYKIPEALSQLLYDNGMSFTKADVPKWARLSALVWAMLNRGDLQGEVIGDWDFVESTYWRLPAVPALTFESVDVETTHTQAYMNEHVRITLDGAAVELGVRACENWFGKTGNRRLGIVPLWVEDGPSGRRIEMGPMTEQSGQE